MDEGFEDGFSDDSENEYYEQFSKKMNESPVQFIKTL